MAPQRFSFDFDARYRLAARPFGVTASSAFVELDEDRFVARFGPWLVETPRANIRTAGASGPYSLAKTIGPAHLSFSDQGLTFATNGREGVCIEFREPVTGIDPLGKIRHPGLTVTVADPDALVDALTTDAPVLRTDLERQETEQAAVDDLHTMTASQLRTLADDLGVAHTSSMNKARLVKLIESKVGEELVEVVEEHRS
ncbi:Rho termination factor N-terminal domain-containing protein [Aquihabitans daechungensis]|uniref:Rho termination factor N-terminal domain-containing protein n=1 Tax=Aquihabitans daechungensis TaxID=1052257 RepID=UPI003BA35A0E